MNWRHQAWAVVMIVVAVTWSNAAADQIARPTMNVSGYPQIIFGFDLIGDDGNILSGQVPGDVVLQEDGSIVEPALHFGQMNDPTAIVIAIDVSKSMLKVWPYIRSGVVSLLESLPMETGSALTAFDDRSRIVADFHVSRNAQIDAVGLMQPTGDATELFYGIHSAMEMLKDPGLSARKFLIVISDGKNEGGAYDLTGNITEAERLGVSIIGLGVDLGDGTEWRNLERLSLETGGVFIPLDASASAKVGFDRVGDHLGSRWHAVWMTDLPDDGEVHSFSLEVKSPGGGGKIEIDHAIPVQPKPLEAPLWKSTEALIAGGGAVLLGLVLLLVLIIRRRRRQVESVDFPETAGIEPTVVVPTGPLFAKITATHEGEEYGEYGLHDTPLAVGRDVMNDIMLPDSQVSRQHVKFSVESGVCYLHDLGSSNGTWLNGTPLSGSLSLADGDHVKVGPFDLVINFEARS